MSLSPHEVLVTYFSAIHYCYHKLAKLPVFFVSWQLAPSAKLQNPSSLSLRSSLLKHSKIITVLNLNYLASIIGILYQSSTAYIKLPHTPSALYILQPTLLQRDLTIEATRFNNTMSSSDSATGGIRRWQCCHCLCSTHIGSNVCSRLSCSHRKCSDCEEYTTK